MYNPLKVSLENIIPLTEARDHFSQIVNEVQKDKLYVLTKGGKPAVAIIDVKYLETLTGGEIKEENVQAEIEKNPEKVGIPPMIQHLEPKPVIPMTPKPTMPPPLPPPPKPEMPKPNPVPPPKPFTPPLMPKPATPVVPKSIPTPTPSIQMPEEKPNPVPPPPPLPPKPTPVPPSPVPAPPATIETGANQPLKTPPIAPDSQEKINIQTSSDEGDEEKSTQDKSAPEDKVGPAQYGGDSNQEEPDDMVID